MTSRTLTCEACEGHGWFPSLVYGPDERCTPCNGTGECEVEVEPIEMEDLDEEALA